MYPLQWFLFVYVLGGLTFVPLVFGLLVAFVYFTSTPPDPDRLKAIRNDPAGITRPNDENLIFKTGTDDLEEKFHRKHDSDVAAGYFAVCREYVPGGVNGKPPDKLTPAGEVANKESPSVYQTMYRSIFDRTQKASIDTGKDGGRPVKKVNNVFYVVLRHGHLMLYDDIQQLDVRYVISLDYHDVDIYGGSDDEILPEGELWVKRNSIRLKRRQTNTGEKGASLPFFLFSESLSDKEDFYHVLLKNQERGSEDVPEAEDFDVKYIVGLVQKLHSSEGQLQTRWLNAMIGRLFLAIYKTPELEEFIKSKLMKKISRVKKPMFITKLSLLKIDTGTAGPFITNPRLKDLTVNGDCMVEADVEYTGNFRLEIGATARIDLGKRLGAREVEMVLAVTVKRVHGHALARFKPPPSNRIWFTFEKMPDLDLAVEPIVSTRQIRYTIILKAIESRIREVIAESLVLPFWDDLPFLRTEGQKYRGGIWKREKAGTTPVEINSEEPEDEAEAGRSGTRTPDVIDMMKKEDRNMSTLSMPVLPETKKSPYSRKTVASLSDYEVANGERTSPARRPRVLRAPSFGTVVDPKLTANHAGIDATKQDGASTPKRESSAATILKDLSARSSGGTPPGSSSGSPPVEGSLAGAMKDRSSSITSKGSRESMNASSRQSTADLSTVPTAGQNSRPTTPSRSANNSRPPSLHEDGREKTLAKQAKSMANADQRKQAIASATAAAQKWSSMGWGVLAKKKTQGPSANEASEQEPPSPLPGGIPKAPMGRGQPLPPPGTPLPKPQRATMMSSISSMVPKRKPVLPTRPGGNGPIDAIATANESPPKPLANAPAPPPLPSRRHRQSSRAELSHEDGEDDVLVVEAPMESAPTSPAAERRTPAGEELTDDFFGHGEEANDGSRSHATGFQQEESDHGDKDDERVTAIQSDAARPARSAPSLPPRLLETQDQPPSYTEIEGSSNEPGKRQPPDLPPRTPTTPSSSEAPAPASRTSSIKRKPLSRTATLNSTTTAETNHDTNATGAADSLSAGVVGNAATPEGHFEQWPLSPEAFEGVNEERKLRMMEGASWGGGYNE
jgi:hypothetical protein